MVNSMIARIRSGIPIAGIFFVCLMIIGCQHVSRQPEPAAASAAPPPPSEDVSALKNKNERLGKVLAKGEDRIQDLEQEIAGLKIQVWEYEAMIIDLRSRSDSQQKRLDAAIIDVVRAKAKLRSLESKAEAASTIAEAEIAVKTLKRRAASPDEVSQEEIATADQLLEMSTKEFKAQNFGGALYLANQTKGQAQAVHMRLAGEANRGALEGETVFAQPLPLKVLKDNTNLREGPGLNQKISGRLNRDALLVGHSFKGKWIRVATQDGVAGWIFQSLVGPR